MLKGVNFQANLIRSATVKSKITNINIFRDALYCFFIKPIRERAPAVKINPGRIRFLRLIERKPSSKKSGSAKGRDTNSHNIINTKKIINAIIVIFRNFLKSFRLLRPYAARTDSEKSTRNNNRVGWAVEIRGILKIYTSLATGVGNANSREMIRTEPKKRVNCERIKTSEKRDNNSGITPIYPTNSI